MKILQKSLLAASLISIGTAGSISFINLSTPTIAHAEVNTNLNATVTIRVPRAQLYDRYGAAIAKGLTQGTAWHTDSQQSTAIGNLYRVATNEYVRANDVNVLINTPGIAENNNHYQGQIALHNYDLKITAQNAPLYDMNGNRLSRALNQGSTWKVGIQNNLPSGTYYSVSSTEYVKASDAYLYSTIQTNPNQTIRITTNYAAPVSNQYGQIIPGRHLDAYTYWKTDGYKTINNIGYYHVGTNEYVNAYYVR